MERPYPWLEQQKGVAVRQQQKEQQQQQELEEGSSVAARARSSWPCC
jgi:hypothetical protein